MRSMSVLVFLAASVAAGGADVTGYRLIAAWGTSGSGPGEFQEPMGVAVDAQGDIYVADSRNRRVQKFSARGKFLAEFGGPDAFKKPVDAARAPTPILRNAALSWAQAAGGAAKSESRSAARLI